MTAIQARMRDRAAQFGATAEAQPEIDQVAMASLPPGYVTRAKLAVALAGFYEISPSIFHRWATRGARGVVLQSWFVGGRRVTTREALAAFLRALNAPQVAAGTPGRSPAARNRDHAKAEAELDRLLG